MSSHLGTIWGAWSFPRVAVLILVSISTWDGCLRESLSIPQGNQATCTVCCGTRDSYGANDREWASSCVDFGYTDLFCIPELTSECISSFDSVLGDSLGFYQENCGSLLVELGIQYCSARNAGKSILISQWGVCLMGFLELLSERGVYSRVTTGMAIRNSTLFSEVRTPV